MDASNQIYAESSGVSCQNTLMYSFLVYFCGANESNNLISSFTENVQHYALMLFGKNKK
jgi:hypothetical protein